MSSRFQVFHRNFSKIRIPETVWISTSRKTTGQEQTLQDPKHKALSLEKLCAYHWTGHQENIKASHGDWAATTASRGNLAQREPTVCANRSAGARERWRTIYFGEGSWGDLRMELALELGFEGRARSFGGGETQARKIAEARNFPWQNRKDQMQGVEARS